ncbi:MAG: hypothetical protein HY042_08300, partial [Spirochaetia bacterium]|nr:hypothetical protein [Spirochaetia bacterium]
MTRSIRHTSTAVLLLVIACIITPVRSEEPEVKVPAGQFLAQFRDIEIADFLKTMAQITKKNILIDDSVKGKITVVSYKPIPVTRALDFLKQVLEVKGFAVVEEPNLIKVIQVDKGSAASQPQAQEEEVTADSTGLVTRVVRLHGSVNINELSGVLKSIAEKTTTVAPYRPTNSIIITGYAQNVRRVLSVMKELGVDKEGRSGAGGLTVDGETVHVYNVRHMKAETLADVLVRLDNPAVPTTPATDPNNPQQQQQQQQVQAPKPGSKIKAVAHKESNALVVTASGQEWREILQIIEQLDQTRQ